MRAYYEGDGVVRLRGAILDEKPAGLYFADDDEPLPIHQMVVDLFLDVATLTIREVAVVMEVTPHLACTRIESKYDLLVGLSIGRGFARAVTERFAGVEGCTHIGALLRAMAPVAIQSMWGMRMVDPGVSVFDGGGDDETARREAMAFNLDSCHVWDERGELAQATLRGEPISMPVWAERRLDKLGRPMSDWEDW